MEQRAFFERVREAHALAVERVGSVDLPLDIAGRCVNVSIASSTIFDRLTPALLHRRNNAESGRRSLHLLAWDTASTGVPAPPPPWGANDYRQKGHIQGFNTDGIHTAFHVGANVLSMFDEASGVGIFWTPDADTLPDNHPGSPFLIVFQWWAETQGLTLIHAGAVGTEHGGVLLAGAGGSGKSTTALSCVGAGLRYVSDDYCLLETSHGDRAHSIFNTGKLDAFSLNLLPHLRPFVVNHKREGTEKAVIYVAESMPETLVDSLPINAILLPHPSGSESTTYRKASPAEALRALAPSTIFQLTGAGSRSFAEMVSVVRRIPCFHLDLGSHMKDAPACIQSILQELA